MPEAALPQQSAACRALQYVPTCLLVYAHAYGMRNTCQRLTKMMPGFMAVTNLAAILEQHGCWC